MTENTTKIETTTSASANAAERGESETIPTPEPQPALALTPAPGEITLTLTLRLSELGVIAASLQTCVRAGAIVQPDRLNDVNSVLRKFHDAKLAHMKEHS